MSPPDTDPMDIDGDVPLSAAERVHLRRMLRDDDRATWARKKLVVLIPLGVAIVTVLWQLIEWTKAHISFR